MNNKVELASLLENTNFETFDSYYSNNLLSILHFELIELINNNVPVRRCKTCKRYFILKKERPDTIYCNRFYKDTSKRCNEIGASISFRDSLKDPIKGEKRKAEKRANEQFHKNDTEENRLIYIKWQNDTEIKMEQYNKGEISEVDILTWLNCNRLRNKTKSNINKI